MQRIIRLAVAAAAALVIAWLAVLWQFGDNWRETRSVTRQEADTVPIGGPFDLIDHTGRAVTQASWPDRHLLIYFGYSFCPDICPLELEKMSRALERVEDEAPELMARVQPLFITVDPERDTPARLAEYVAFFHPSLVGLGGSESQVEAAAAAYRVYYQKARGQQDDSYLMDHSSIIFLMSPNNQYRRHFTVDDSADQIADALIAVLGQARG